MKTRVIASAAIAVLLLNLVVATFADTPAAKAKKASMARLVGLLPASDGVVVFDSRRFFDVALPGILTANQPMLTDVLDKITAMEARTGIDLRKFEQVAVGIAFKEVTPTEVDFEPVAVASGDVNAGAMAAIGKLKTNGTYREEKIGSRTVYVISPKAVVPQPATTPSSKIAGMIDKGLKGLSQEVAVATIDRNTLVIGTLDRVRQTLGASSRVAPDIAGLLSSSDAGVMSFAARPTAGLTKMLPLDNDMLGTNISSIQYLSGSLEVAGSGASLHVAARTEKPEQARGLKKTVEGLQLIGKVFLGSSKRADQQVYGRLAESVKLAVRGNDLLLDLHVPQSEIDILLAAK